VSTEHGKDASPEVRFVEVYDIVLLVKLKSALKCILFIY